MNKSIRALVVAILACSAISGAAASGPSFVDITWMSIANMYYELGSLKVITDGYITRIPLTNFYGGGGGLKQTRKPWKPDVTAVTEVMTALGGPSSVNLLLTGHSHFDHSFDTAVWSKLTGARVIGPKTTCYQTGAQGIATSQCTGVYGKEKIVLADGVTMRVVRWNHSGDSRSNPEQHNPVELGAQPTLDPATGGLRAGVAEDFPNGGGGRGFLFTVSGPSGQFSWFYQNSASASDLKTAIVVGGTNYGAPLDNLKAAMADAGLQSVDLWIGSADSSVGQLVLPVLKPKNYIPIHWDGLGGSFHAGVTKPYSDPSFESLLAKSSVKIFKPAQYMDKWRLDVTGVQSIANTAIKKALGF